MELLQPIDCKVNLIVFNTHEGSRFKPSTPEAVQAFRSIVIQVTARSIQWISALTMHVVWLHVAYACELWAGCVVGAEPLLSPRSLEEVGSPAAQAGRVCTVRDSRGDEEMAACGQLGAPELGRVKAPPMLQPPARLEAVLT